MQHPSIATEIRFAGRVHIWTLPTIARLLRAGLTIEDYTTFALIADQHRLTIEQLCALMLEGEAQR